VPATHATQSSTLSWSALDSLPSLLLVTVVPPRHAVHVVAPASLLYMPTGHTTHDPSYAYVPASHATHAVELLWSAAKSPDVTCPAAHAVHAVEPAASLYISTGHTSHRPVLDDRYVPAAHISQSSELSWSVMSSPDAEEPVGH
jgi:hypothetical protein